MPSPEYRSMVEGCTHETGMPTAKQQKNMIYFINICSRNQQAQDVQRFSQKPSLCFNYVHEDSNEHILVLQEQIKHDGKSVNKSLQSAYRQELKLN